MLHVQTLTVRLYLVFKSIKILTELQTAQQHGLFTAQCAGILDHSIFEHITDVDKKWKAWSRIESTKRSVVCFFLKAPRR